MSQATHSLPLRRQLSAHRVVAVSALLALLATVAVVLVLAIDVGSSQTSAPAGQSTHPAFRADGGPGTSARPDESSVAAAISSAR